MIDFTYKTYEHLISNFLLENYKIITVREYFSSYINTNYKFLVLRHDVDRYPKNAKKMAVVESKLGIKSTYYFRVIPSVYKEDIIKSIQDLGHEVSYHYEDLSLMHGNYEKAFNHFIFNLKRFRNLAPCMTICRHGSPLSKWDNKKLWEKYDYKSFNILGDTDLDINYNSIFYISDNGMGWNKTSTSIRDKVDSRFKISIKNSNNFISLIKENKLHTQIMLNAHPDTFFTFGFLWVFNYSFIKCKNVVKFLIVKLKIIE